MAKVLTDGLSRLQTQSRIPAATWRQWCSLLHIEPEEAVDVWEEICYPIMIATRKVPEVTYILQLRAERMEPDIFDFREEISKVLHFFTFIYNLQDDRLSRGKLKTALLKFYKHVTERIGEGQSPSIFIEQFTSELCALVLVTKVLSGPNITFSGVLKTVGEGRGTIEQVARLAAKSLAEHSYGNVVHDVLADPLVAALEPRAAAEAEEEIDDEDDFDEGPEEDWGDDGDEGRSAAADDGAYGGADLSMEDFLIRFKTALHAIYEAEAEAALEEAVGTEEAIETLLDERLKAISRFNPIESTIPSIEEAQNIARRAELARNPSKPRKGSLGGIASAALMGGGSAAGKRSASEVKSAIMTAKTQKKQADRAKEAAQAAAVGQTAATGAEAEAEAVSDAEAAAVDGRIDRTDTAEVEVSPEDVVEVPEIHPNEFSEKVHQVGRWLATVEKADRVVWGLFIEPGTPVEQAGPLARALSADKSGSYQAYEAIKGVAQCMPLKKMIPPDSGLQGDRNFAVKVNMFINQMNNTNREIAADNRQLGPLKGILDCAGACLLRLEALRTNRLLSEKHPEGYTRDAVTLYYEQSLRAVTDEADRGLLTVARQQADKDTAVLLEAFAVRRMVDGIVESCRQYAADLCAEGAADAPETLAATLATRPVQFDGVERQEGVPPTDEQLGLPSGLGTVFDTFCRYLSVEARAVLQKAHKPDEVLRRIHVTLRQVLARYLEMKPEKKRHMEMPQMALSVVGLDKLTGNAALKDLFARVGEDGHLAVVADYEDGSYADIFELREYQPMRMASNQQKQAAATGEEVLQTGHKYLYSVGRTNHFFGATPSEVINGCVRKEDGSIQVFTTFN